MKHLQITSRITPRDSRIVDTYLRDIAQHPLLTVNEEVELAQKIRQGDECALERLILGIGLVIAAKRYDETRGNKFCSYAIWWIRQSIMQSLAKEGRTLTLPANQLGLLSKMNKEISRMEQELQRSPSRAEVADRLKEKDENLRRLMRSSQQPLSLDAALMRESLHDDVEHVLSNLPQNECRVLKMYFGIGHPRSYSMDEIGLRIGMSRERVRQLHNKALLRLQRSSTKELLRDYL